jgi:hypothetical protein
MVIRTATPPLNGTNWWYSAARNEFRALFPNGPQRSVNRKVQGSNPCSGAKSEFEFEESTAGRRFTTSVLHQFYINWLPDLAVAEP